MKAVQCLFLFTCLACVRTLPAATVENMYAPGVRARTEMGRLVIEE